MSPALSVCAPRKSLADLCIYLCLQHRQCLGLFNSDVRRQLLWTSEGIRVCKPAWIFIHFPDHKEDSIHFENTYTNNDILKGFILHIWLHYHLLLMSWWTVLTTSFTNSVLNTLSLLRWKNLRDKNIWNILKVQALIFFILDMVKLCDVTLTFFCLSFSLLWEKMCNRFTWKWFWIIIH